MENLPNNVLSEIFIRLLAKQLAQLRCVSKSWNALLYDSSFIKAHLHHSIESNDEILLFFGIVFSFELSPTSFTARPSCSPDLELPNFLKLPVIREYKFGCGSIIGSVNGLICFYYVSDHNVVRIWNPSLSALLTLPSSPWRPRRLQFGFGFDPKTQDYKVVRITTFPEPTNMEPQCEVYSMKKGSWESKSQRLPSPISLFGGRNQVCVDDHLHWLGSFELPGKPLTIVAFNLGSEVLIEIPLPQSILDCNWYNCSTVLGVLGGKLCVISCVEDGECEVWVMEEYGVSESWVKHHAFSQLGGDITPYGFTSHSEFVFHVDKDDDRIGLYDPVAAKTKTFQIMWRYSSIRRFVEYVDSLVWIQPPNCEISSCDISHLQIGK